MIGQTVSHYRIVSKLGQGGMGVVYKAEDTKIGRTVALKFLPETLTQGSDAKDRFIREARSAGQLDHPNVCTIHEVNETDEGQLYLVMAYYDGATLEERIAEGPLPVDEALNVARQIASGLDKAHAAGMVHRDIKPANILLTSDGLVKIVDFGLAKLSDDTMLTRTGTTLGTACYMAPEQASGGESDHRADIWSLTVVIYEMLTGEIPFKGDFLPAVVYAIVHSEPATPSGLNPELDATIDQALLKGLAKDPDDRFASAGELATALGAEAGPGSDSMVPLTKFNSRSTLQKKSFALSRRVVFGVIVLALAAAGIFATLSLRDHPPLGALDSPPARSRSLVILPFSFQGDETESHLAGQFAQFLADRFHSTGDLHVVTGDTLFPYLTSVEKSGADIQGLSGTATRLQADLVMTGKVTSIQGNLQVELSFANQEFTYDTINSQAVPLNQLLEYADRMALKSVPNLFYDPPFQISRMAAKTSDNWPAVKHFIESEKYRRRMGNNGWGKELDACLEADSTMALAYYSKFERARWFDNRRGMLEAARNARRHAQSLPQEGRDLIEAANLYLDHELDEAENLLNRILLTNRFFVEAWYLLAGLSYDANYLRGRSITESREALDKVAELDPQSRIPNIFLRFLWAKVGEIDTLEQWLTPTDGRAMHPSNMAILAFMRDDIQLQDALADSMNLKWINEAQALVLNVPDNHWNSLRFLEHLDSHVEDETAQGWVKETMANLEAGLGRWVRAREHFEAMPERLHPWRLTYQAIMMSMPFMQCSPEDIEAHIREIRSWRPLANYPLDPDAYGLSSDRYAPDFALHFHMKEFSLGLLQTRLGDLDAARAALHRLEALPLPAENGPMVNEMVLSVRGWIAFEEERYDDVMTILEDAAQYSLVAMSYSGLHDRPYQRYLRALTLEKLGRPAEATPWFEYISEKTERTLGFVAPAHLQLGGIYEQTGDHAKALHHYQAFLKLYRDCDEKYQPLVEKARLRVAALEG